MLSRIFFFIVRTIVFFAFLGWLASEFLIGGISLAPDKPHDIENQVNSSGGLIVPGSDPRFSNSN
ncbi:hypothetical protein GOA66_21485 [Sinorhizobium meliloti]|nr:hypothetical protein [Sinorhizobium meliloti]